MSTEKDNYTNPEHTFDSEKLRDISAERARELSHEREQAIAAERSQERREVEARKEALEQAAKVEKSKLLEARKDSPAEKRGPATRREREDRFNRTMREVRLQMPGPSRIFSSLIHHPVVEKVSDALGGTVARPNAIAAGSVVAFLATLSIYLVARFYGYPLSGTETIAAFALGWIIGVIYDYFRILIVGKK